MIQSYSKIYALGHMALDKLLENPVTVEEKVDGSQFSFGLVDGQLHCRSRSVALDIEAPDKMFALAVERVKAVAHKLEPNWVYRGEYLNKPKHNTLAYDRTPRNNIAIFDVDMGGEHYLSPAAKAKIAEELNMEAVPLLSYGVVASAADVHAFLEKTSFLGGQKIEGVVLKAYGCFGKDGKTLMGKYVSEAFKEVHRGDWKGRHPAPADIRDQLVGRYRTPARWAKAVQHLAEAGKLVGEPRDIGPLIAEIQADLKTECGDEIRELLYVWAKDYIMRGVVAGAAEWYKNRLLEAQFDNRPADLDAKS